MYQLGESTVMLKAEHSNHLRAAFHPVQGQRRGDTLILQLSALHNHQVPRPEAKADQAKVLFEMEPQKATGERL